MNKKIIINDTILYLPSEHRLCPLRARGKETVLNVPASRCLQLMLQRPGEVISQSDFFNEVWQKNGQYVTANTLYQNISLVRKGMREAGLSKNVIRTVPKVGVVFFGTVEIQQEESSNVIAQPSNKPVQPLFEELQAEMPQPKSTGLNRSKLLRYGLFTAFILAMLILLASNQSQSARFFDSHTKAATINHCSVYIDRDDLETNVAGYKEYLIANNVVCNPDEFVYITRTPANHSTLVLFCDTTAQGDLRCSSRFQIDNQHDPLSGLRPAERQ
ncbi:winged helix-turn-helix domain-containing protein [Serratia fonticola]|uniref:winged helix-turn-helix domain-containing protein n=1 Tax=Serratia fonticola TaxID=47917 RepID=UPI0015C67982|nr:winged helix-turn-helix domain-containing protein [Serratia fonticola]MBC3378701.1 winged helix-turn-helix domain-containing protein [Serratia fonticola]NYA37901.1 winged helix-turn-helix domain-containing protein [Serratia fonticola]